MLASDLNNPEFVGAADPDARLHAEFYVKAVENAFKSEQEGRPIFDDVVFVRILVPGDDKNIIDTPARDDHKARFPRHWAHFQNTHGESNLQAGTPLEQWPALTPSQVASLKALKFYTVDSIALAGDEKLGRIGMTAGMSPHAFRDKARRYLEVAKDTAQADKQAQELEKAHKAVAEMQAQMQAMQAQMQELAGQPRGKPGPKPKNQATEVEAA